MRQVYIYRCSGCDGEVEMDDEMGQSDEMTCADCGEDLYYFATYIKDKDADQ